MVLQNTCSRHGIFMRGATDITSYNNSSKIFSKDKGRNFRINKCYQYRLWLGDSAGSEADMAILLIDV